MVIEIEEMIIEKEVRKMKINAIIVVKKAIGKMNAENQEDQDLDLIEKEEDRIVVQVLKVENILKKENIHLVAAEVKVLKIKNQEKKEIEVEADQILLNLNHEDLNLRISISQIYHSDKINFLPKNNLTSKIYSE